MKLRLGHISFLLMTCLTALLSQPLEGQEIKLENGLTIDKAVHNFGDILMKDGPVNCTFTVTNKGKQPAVIYNVVTTCGCTDVKWTRQPIRAGESGKITVTYSNDEGPYPFNKNITVYFSKVRKPVVLKLKGRSQEKPLSLEDTYRLKFGPLGLEKDTFFCGNMTQGESRSNVEIVANLSEEPIKIEFTDISDCLDIKVQPNPIPARSTARLHFCVTSSRNKWGKNNYVAVPVINGKREKSNSGSNQLTVNAFTIENFSETPDVLQESAPVINVDMSAYDFGKIRKGTDIEACFEISNAGKSDLQIHKVDADANGFSHNCKKRLKPGEKQNMTVRFDTCCVPEGEFLALVTLTTNAPARPYVNLFVTGIIE